MKKKTKNTLITILVFVLVFSLALAFFVRLGNDETKNTTFSVEYDGKTYSGEDNELVLLDSGKAEFKINNASDYNVKILPTVNEESNFTFRVDNGAPKTFGSLNFTSAFDITETEKGFEINCENDYSVYGVLKRLYNSANIVLPTIDNEASYFMLCIENSSGDVIKIAFKQGGYVITEDLKFDKGGIVF